MDDILSCLIELEGRRNPVFELLFELKARGEVQLSPLEAIELDTKIRATVKEGDAEKVLIANVIGRLRETKPSSSLQVPEGF